MFLRAIYVVAMTIYFSMLHSRYDGEAPLYGCFTLPTSALSSIRWLRSTSFYNLILCIDSKVELNIFLYSKCIDLVFFHLSMNSYDNITHSPTSNTLYYLYTSLQEQRNRPGSTERVVVAGNYIRELSGKLKDRYI